MSPEERNYKEMRIGVNLTEVHWCLLQPSRVICHAIKINAGGVKSYERVTIFNIKYFLNKLFLKFATNFYKYGIGDWPWKSTQLNSVIVLSKPAII